MNPLGRIVKVVTQVVATCLIIKLLGMGLTEVYILTLTVIAMYMDIITHKGETK